jgi:hypothetical protein
MRVIKITPDGVCSLVNLDNSIDLWVAIKKEFDRTNALGYHTIVTRAKDAIYEFFYDDSGEWACSEANRNTLAEDLTKLVWYGPCLITKLDIGDADLDNDSDFEEVVYNESKKYTDVTTHLQDQDTVIDFVHQLRVVFK